MDVKYITTTSDRLSELSVVNGQLIYLSDLNATYYDMGNSRRLMSSMRLVPALPSTGSAQEGVLYGLVNASGNVDASVWDASASTYRMLSGYVATNSSLGLVKPDGTTITIDSNGTISCVAASELPATSVTYDNTLSGLASTTAQGAIDEVSATASGASTAAAQAISDAAAASTAAAAASTVAAEASTAAAGASTAAAAASTVAQSAYDTAAAASTAATEASTIAAGASTAAAAASTAASAAYDLAAAASTAITSIETRLSTLEAAALIVEDNNLNP